MSLGNLFIGLENAMAQDNRSNYSEQRLKLQAEMMALDMAERYGLDEKQVKKLTEANLIWLQERGNGSWLYDSPCYDYRHDVGQTIAIVAGDVVETYAMKTIVARPIAQTDTTHTIVNIMMPAMRMMKSSGKS